MGSRPSHQSGPAAIQQSVTHTPTAALVLFSPTHASARACVSASQQKQRQGTRMRSLKSAHVEGRGLGQVASALYLQLVQHQGVPLPPTTAHAQIHAGWLKAGESAGYCVLGRRPPELPAGSGLARSWRGVPASKPALARGRGCSAHDMWTIFAGSRACRWCELSGSTAAPERHRGYSSLEPRRMPADPLEMMPRQTPIRLATARPAASIASEERT